MNVLIGGHRSRTCWPARRAASSGWSTATRCWSAAPSTGSSKIAHRLEVLDGYLIAYLNIDEVIRIVRDEDEPRPS